MAASPARRARRRATVTARRLLGLDRSGPPPEATRPGQPLNPWTLPNAIGMVRLALIPVAVAIALRSDDGRTAAATILFAVVGFSDYLDGLAARLTGQYSRLGAILDPLTDRVLVLAASVVAFKFALLPRWALALLAARELFMLAATELAKVRGIELQIDQVGRWALWPTLLAFFVTALWETWVATALLYVGLLMSLVASVRYVRGWLSAARTRRETGRAQQPRPSTSA